MAFGIGLLVYLLRFGSGGAPPAARPWRWVACTFRPTPIPSDRMQAMRATYPEHLAGDSKALKSQRDAPNLVADHLPFCETFMNTPIMVLCAVLSVGVVGAGVVLDLRAADRDRAARTTDYNNPTLLTLRHSRPDTKGTKHKA